MLQEIKATMLKDPAVVEFLSIAKAPYKEVSETSKLRYNELFVGIAMRYDLRYSEMRELLGTSPNLGPVETPFADYDKIQDVLLRVRDLWNREGFGSDPAESDLLFRDLYRVIKTKP